jgi:hydroxymethylglutaryl-CoA lyase
MFIREMRNYTRSVNNFALINYNLTLYPLTFELKIIETPRDAFQGIKQFIPTETKVQIINTLLRAGFDTVEAGSYVSQKVIPQMADTSQVLRGLDRTGSTSRVMVLVVNKRGAMRAVRLGTVNCEPRTANREPTAVDDLLFPFSASPTFLKRNLNADTEKAKGIIQDLLEVCDQHKKRLIVYLSMSFGNPYGDPWDPGIIEEYAGYLHGLGQRIIPLSDILGDVAPETIRLVFSRVIKSFPDVEFGAHFHSLPGSEYTKIDAAWKAGVRRFDTVTGGFGGCPMAADHMVSNLDTFALVDYCNRNGIEHGLDLGTLMKAQLLMAESIGHRA